MYMLGKYVLECRLWLSETGMQTSLLSSPNPTFSTKLPLGSLGRKLDCRAILMVPLMSTIVFLLKIAMTLKMGAVCTDTFTSLL